MFLGPPILDHAPIRNLNMRGSRVGPEVVLEQLLDTVLEARFMTGCFTTSKSNTH